MQTVQVVYQTDGHYEISSFYREDDNASQTSRTMQIH